MHGHPRRLEVQWIRWATAVGDADEQHGMRMVDGLTRFSIPLLPGQRVVVDAGT
jgi:hypothetical protein